LTDGLKNANTQQRRMQKNLIQTTFVNIIQDRNGESYLVLEFIKISADHVRSFTRHVRYTIQRYRVTAFRDTQPQRAGSIDREASDILRMD